MSLASTQIFTSWANNWSGTVTSGGTGTQAAGTAETLTVSWSGPIPQAGGPSVGFYAHDPALPSEIFQVYWVNPANTSEWWVIRGADNTTPVAHSSGFTLKPIVPAGYLQNLDDTYQRCAVVTDNFYINNTTTFTHVPSLGAILLHTNSVYEVVFHLAIKADSGADIKTRWEVPTGATGTKFVVGPTSDSAGFTSQGRHDARMSGHALTTAIPYQTYTSVNDNYVIERALVYTNSTGVGELGLEIAQNTATVADTGIGVGSYSTFRKMTPWEG